MGKAAKAHRAKVAKRNANVKLQEKRMQKLWQEAFEEQMNAMKEKFAAMSGDTMSGLTSLLDEENVQEETTQEESEPAEPISGDQTV
jgi:DNA primase large subunit